MSGVRRSTSVLPLAHHLPSAKAASAEVRPTSVGRAPSEAEWDLIGRFGSSVPKYSLGEILSVKADTPPPAIDAKRKLIDALNLATLRDVDKGLQSATARLATLAPLLSGATDDHKAKILAELGLGGIPVAEAMSAIDALLKDSAVHTAVWTRPDFTVDADFKQEVDKRLGTEVLSVEPDDLKGAVDGWSFGWTHGRLVDLVPENALKDKQVVVTSAVPNDPLWQTGFNPADTVKEYPFDPQDGTDPVAQVMMVGVIDCTATATENFRAAAIPMSNGSSFTAVVPADGIPVSEILQPLKDPEALRNFFAGFESIHGVVYVPKMRVVGAVDMTGTLGPASKGPYRAVGSEPVHLDAALAATSIKLDEQGISHAGGSSAQLAAGKAKGVPFEVIECAKPFLFMLRDDATGLIKCAGIYRGPGEKPHSDT